ncbi:MULTISPECIES: hypothetical protein [16SrI (Aster yellows group)]|uniref:Uncharacterized protein n=3 Tax=16SrI (Aster yellows group) TaxID=3042590 RepID=A0A859I982_9MOLU|nr:hypothetical protein [Chrysanthemum yellows phytoplasma]QKX95117.1 MAG: hypothetical protein RP166_1040 [Rapeseed phyllody phytoplasma]
MKNNATIGGNNVIQLILKNKLKIPFISTLLLTDGLIILLCFILEFFQPAVIKLTPEKIYLKYLNSIITFLMIIFLIYKLSSKMPIPPSKNNKSKKTNKPYKAKIKKVKTRNYNKNKNVRFNNIEYQNTNILMKHTHVKS